MPEAGGDANVVTLNVMVAFEAMSDVADITLEEIIAKLREIAPAIRAEGVTKLTAPGSPERSDAPPDNDLGVLIDTVARGG